MANHKHVLVVGASGFLGSHVLDNLDRLGIKAIGFGPTQPIDSPTRSNFVIGRSTDLELTRDLLDDCRALIYVGGKSRPAAGWSSITQEISAEASHVMELAKICAEKGVERIIFTSSGGTVYGKSETPSTEGTDTRPINAYGLSKVVAEHGLGFIVRTTDLKAVVLRVANPFGPRQLVKGSQGFIAAALDSLISQSPITIWGDGSTVRDFIFVTDVANAFGASLQLDSKFEILNVSSGSGVSLASVCEKVQMISERPLTKLYEEWRDVDVPVSILDNSKARKLLNWKPLVSLDQGIRHTMDWWNRGPDY